MSKLHLSGRCLCGSVRYELSGSDAGFYHCHCERCRKATGTGHATNIIVKDYVVNWTAGENLLVRYEVPEAQRFAVVFCSRCGSNMPRVSPKAGIAVIPAGTLDHDPEIRPNARIFFTSRAEWSCTDAVIPCYDGYPA